MLEARASIANAGPDGSESTVLVTCQPARPTDKVKVDAKADKMNAAAATTAVKAEGKADVKAATVK